MDENKRYLYNLSYSKLTTLECEYAFWKTYLDEHTDVSIQQNEFNDIGSRVHEELTHVVLDEETHKFKLDNISSLDDELKEFCLRVVNSEYNNDVVKVYTNLSYLVDIRELNCSLYFKPDLVLLKNDSIDIIEFKTFTMRFTLFDQLFIYLYALMSYDLNKDDSIEMKELLEKVYELGSVNLTYHFLSEDRVLSKHMSISLSSNNTNNETWGMMRYVSTKLVDSIIKIDRILKAVENGNTLTLKTNKNSKFCKYCPSRGICPAHLDIIRATEELINNDSQLLTTTRRFDTLPTSEKLESLRNMLEQTKEMKKVLESFIDQVDNEIYSILNAMSHNELMAIKDVIKIIRTEKKEVDEERARDVILEKLIEDAGISNINSEFLKLVIDNLYVSKSLLKRLNIDEDGLIRTINKTSFQFVKKV